jgi:hypothetical protein
MVKLTIVWETFLFHLERCDFASETLIFSIKIYTRLKYLVEDLTKKEEELQTKQVVVTEKKRRSL